MKKQLVFIFCLLSMIPIAQGQQWEEITFKRPPFLAERLFPGISSIACDSEYLYVFHEGTAVALLDRKDYLVRYIKTVKSDPQANGGMSILPMKSSTIVNTPVGIYVRFPGVDH